MAKKDNNNGGIARLYAAQTHSHLIFAATYALKMETPERDTTEIVTYVLRLFNLNMTPDAGLRAYYRIEKIYLENGGA